MIAVTGASGHLGGNLVRALLEQGKRVRVLIYQDRRAIEGLEVETVRGDILDQHGSLAILPARSRKPSGIRYPGSEKPGD